MIEYKRVVDNKMRDFGRIDTDKREIRINKRKGGVLDTIFHEETHRLHPRMFEKTVRKKTTAALKRMGPKEKRSLFSKYR